MRAQFSMGFQTMVGNSTAGYLAVFKDCVFTWPPLEPVFGTCSPNSHHHALGLDVTNASPLYLPLCADETSCVNPRVLQHRSEGLPTWRYILGKSNSCYRFLGSRKFGTRKANAISAISFVCMNKILSLHTCLFWNKALQHWFNGGPIWYQWKPIRGRGVGRGWAGRNSTRRSAVWGGCSGGRGTN